MDISFKMKGFEELQKQLKRMSPADSSRIAKIGTREASKILLNEMRDRVPVGKTGNLKRSLGIVNVKRTTPGAWFKVGARSGKRLKYDGWYAHLVEYPTRAHKLKRKNGVVLNHPGTKRQPFMRPAVDAKGKRVINHIGYEIGRAIERFY